MTAIKYDAEQIEVLEGLEPVRLRPGLFVGGTDQKALQHLIAECTDNAIDEHMAGYGNHIDIILQADGGICVTDNARGIPVSMHPTQKRPALEVVMCKLHAGGKFDGKVYQVAAGLHGVGISVTNALSKRLDATIWRDGFEWYQKYEKGVPITDVGKKKKSNKTGTRILFYPDDSILTDINVKAESLVRRMKEISFLCPGLKITISDERDGEEYEFLSNKGISEYMSFLNEDVDGLFPTKPISFAGKANDIEIEIVLQYSDKSGDTILSFCNIIPTTDGGKHESGLKTGLTRTINAFARTNKLLKDNQDNLIGDDIRDGLIGMVCVKVPNPIFESQTKTRLANDEVYATVSQFISEKLTELLDKDPSIGKRIVERALTSQRARAAAKSAAEAIKKKGSSFSMANKLAKCSSKNPKECELFIVEGDSAAGPAKQVRDSRTQAILPLKGKIINSLKARIDKLLDNNEIKNIIYALGTGIANVSLNGEDDVNSLFDLSRLNYDKIILVMDADSDGKHIQLLLLTFFFTFLRPVIEGGHLYIASPPLFKIEVGKNKHYALDEAELGKLLAKYPNGSVTRFKGLGEMNEDELEETAINPNTRNIAQIEIENLGMAEKLLINLMGDKPGPRKEYLAKNASKHFEKIFANEAF